MLIRLRRLLHPEPRLAPFDLTDTFLRLRPSVSIGCGLVVGCAQKLSGECMPGNRAHRNEDGAVLVLQNRRY